MTLSAFSLRVVTLSAPWTFLVACGGQTIFTGDEHQGSSSSSGSGGHAGGTTSATSSTTITTSTTTSTTSTTMAMCPENPSEPFHVDVSIGSDSETLLDGCSKPVPWAAYGSGGECASGIVIVACGNAGEPLLSLLAVDLTDAGTTDAGSASYSLGATQFYASDATIAVDLFDEIGMLASGSFAATMSATGDPTDTITASGSFFVCHVEDVPPCP